MMNPEILPGRGISVVVVSFVSLMANSKWQVNVGGEKKKRIPVFISTKCYNCTAIIEHQIKIVKFSYSLKIVTNTILH